MKGTLILFLELQFTNTHLLHDMAYSQIEILNGFDVTR